MDDTMQFSSEEELWSEISNFPGYSISTWGRVMNTDTRFFITPTRKPQGLMMVGLMKNCVQHKRSLPLLVAIAFVSRQYNESFDTPVHVDGDRSNNHYRNLMWRPLWFARKYMKQFVDDHNTFDFPIEDVETGEFYKNSMHASVVNGLLDVEIRLSMLTNTYVWPTGQIFREPVGR